MLSRSEHRSASPRFSTQFNVLHLFAACLFFLAVYPAGAFSDDAPDPWLIGSVCAGFIACAFQSRRSFASFSLVPSGLDWRDAAFLVSLGFLLVVMSFDRLTADLWSDGVYHASLASRSASIFLLNAEANDPGLWSRLAPMKAGLLIQAAHITTIAALAFLFAVLPRLIGRFPIALALVWIIAFLAARYALSSDSGLIADAEKLPVWLAETENKDPHPPLRLLPVMLSSAIAGATPLGFRLAGFLALFGFATFFYVTLCARTGRVLAALGAVSLATLPALLQTAGLVEASIWPALAGALLFTVLAKADRPDTHLPIVVLAAFGAMATLMRAPGFLCFVPLGALIVLEFSRRPVARDEALTAFGLMGAALAGSAAFVMFGTPAISDAPATVQIYSALRDGIPAIALITAVGLVPFLFVGSALPITSTPSALRSMAMIGFLAVSVAVFYGPTKSVLWGTPRYQAEIAAPLITAGVTAFLLQAVPHPDDFQIRSRVVSSGALTRAFSSLPLLFLIGANIFSWINIDLSRARFLDHPIPGDTKAADARYELRRAWEVARDHSPSSTPYYVGIWYGGLQSVLLGETAEQYARFAHTNARHRTDWTVDFESVLRDADIQAIIVERDAPFGANEYFDEQGWPRDEVIHSESGLILDVYKRPAGPEGMRPKRQPMPEIKPEFAEWLNQPFAEVFPGVLPDCRAFVDGPSVYYDPPRAGARLSGWGFHSIPKTPFDLVLVTDVSGIIVSVGEGGIERGDVKTAFPDLADARVGFGVDVPIVDETLVLYGASLATGAICELARPLEFAKE